MLLLKEESWDTLRPAFMETSPETTNVPCIIEFPLNETDPLVDEIFESPIEIEFEPH